MGANHFVFRRKSRAPSFPDGDHDETHAEELGLCSNQLASTDMCNLQRLPLLKHRSSQRLAEYFFRKPMGSTKYR